MVKISPVPNQRTAASSNNEIGVLSLIHNAKPRAINNIASVAINGTTFPYAIAAPLTEPSTTPNNNAPTMNGTLPLSITRPPATPAAATIEPTDKSIPAVAITNVIPIANTPTTLPWRNTLNMLSLDMNDSPSRTVPAISSKITTPTSAYSW